MAAFPEQGPVLGMEATERPKLQALLKHSLCGGVESQVNQCCHTLCCVTKQRTHNSSILMEREENDHLSQTRKGVREGFLEEVILEC